VPRLLTTVSHVAQARLHQISRRAASRGKLMAGAAVAGLVVCIYALIAVTVAFSHQYGTIGALLIVGGIALLVLLGFLLALGLEAQRHRRLAPKRAALDQQIYRAAALSLIPNRAPPRPVVGFGLVALGAALVFWRRRG
jgi:hypothetical protein